MQTVETLNEGLKRAYTLTIGAKEIDKKVDAELKRVAPQVRMPGFRPGKVPANLVRKMHGPALMQDALNSSIQDGVQQLIAEKQLRPAMQPSVELADGYAPGKDAEIKVALEVLPQVPAPKIEGLKLERLTVPVSDAQVDEQLTKIAEQQSAFESYPSGRKAVNGDVVVLDFVGKVGGEPFDGGTGQGMKVKLGSGMLIPGFEDQLLGVKAGEERELNVTFPADYTAEELKGKAATFEIKATDILDPTKPKADDEMAKSFGLDSLDKLRELIRGQIEQEHNGLTRTHMKRKLLDQLAEGHDFEVPPSMVDAEFGQIWAQLEHEATHEADPEAARKEMESEREDYRRIAERRVRLGLLLSEIGQQAGVEISQQEMNRLIMQAAQQYQPADRERFIQYVQQEPMAAAQLRAPLYEDKVVDHLFTTADIADRETTREELQAAIESEDGHVHGPGCGHDHDHDHDHAPKTKKAAAKKPAGKAAKVAATEVTAADVEPAAPDAPATAEAPVKKAATKKAPAAKAEAAPAVETEAKAPKKAAAKKPAAKAEGDAGAVEDAAPAKKAAPKKAAAKKA